MSLSNRPTEPGLETAVANLARVVHDLARMPGEWINVGTYPSDPDTVPESPPFENGWLNVGGDARPPFSFRIDKWQNVHLRGAVTGGAVGTVITTLPVGYRPDYRQEFVCSAGDGSHFATLSVSFTGAVTLVALGP